MKIIILSLLVTLVSCSSVQKTGQEDVDAVIVHMSKPKVTVGKDWDDKFKKDGLLNGEFVAIGSITNSINSHEGNMKVMAESDATSKLLTSAPTEFKKIVQRAISSVDGGNGSFEQNHVSITEVRALTGLKSGFDDVQCVTTASPNTDLKYDFVKECRVLIRVPASNLMKAYAYTLDKKYGVKEQNEIKEVLNKELLNIITPKPVVQQIEEKQLPVTAKAYSKE